MGYRGRQVALVLVPLCLGLAALALAYSLSLDAPRPPASASASPGGPPSVLVANGGEPAGAAAGQVSVTMAARPYRHPSGAFSVYHPDDWQIDESEDSVQFTAPDDAGQFSITFLPAESLPGDGYELDLRRAWSDTGTFSIVATDSSALPGRWTATFTFQQAFLPESGAVPMHGYAVYGRRESVVYIAMVQTQASAGGSLFAILRAAVDNMETHPSVAFDNSE